MITLTMNYFIFAVLWITFLTDQTNQLIQQNNQLIQINSDQTAQIRMLLDEIVGDEDEPQSRNLDDD